MQVSFFGAAGEVTGSCTLIDTGRARVLIDCGMHQGNSEAEARNRRALPFEPTTLSAAVLTHAHVDHVGRFPLLTNAGFNAKIWATPATCKLAPLLLEDSAQLQEADAQRDTLRNARRGLPEVKPLYKVKDVPAVVGRLTALDFDRPRDIAPGVTLRFSEAGHILGSASVELTCVLADGSRKVLVFSADIGPRHMPLMRDFVPPVSDGVTPDLVVCESTYGDRDHRSLADTEEEFAGVLREAVWSREKVLIPAFAVGRSQTLLYEMNRLLHSGRVPQFGVYLDSPLGIEATKLYRDFYKDMDDATRAQLSIGEDPLGLDHVTACVSGEDSRRLNEMRGPMVIIAGSGMATGGRIVHHLRHNLWKRDVRVIIAGYQAHGSLGRRLVEGASEVRIFGEPIIVRARVHTLGGLSAHAGQSELVEWCKAFRPKNGKPWPALVLTHGERTPREALRARLAMECSGWNASLPEWGAQFNME